jgi:CRP-like cAMP-binding protein
MSSLIRRLSKGEYVFREGEASEEMYVIKSGKIAIVKAKGTGEILLAEKSVGEMVGEMSFFDNRPRSAGAKSVGDTELIVLAFSALNQQFKNFPEWLKVMVKTINGQLREANSRIKNLETATVVDEDPFPPLLITRLSAILSLVGFKSGVKVGEGLELSHGILRDYCIQIFQQPTSKMDRLLEIFQDLKLVTVEELGEGQKRVVIRNHKLISDFTDWYNRYLFTDEGRRVTVEEREMNALRALDHYGRRVTPDHRGNVTVNLTDMQAQAPKDLGFAFGINEADPFVEKGLANEKRTADAGQLTMTFNLASVTGLLPFWEIVYAIKRAKR